MDVRYYEKGPVASIRLTTVAEACNGLIGLRPAFGTIGSVEPLYPSDY